MAQSLYLRHRKPNPSIATYHNIPCHAEVHESDGGNGGETVVFSAILEDPGLTQQQLGCFAILDSSESTDDYYKHFTGNVNVFGRHDTPGVISFQVIDGALVRHIEFTPNNTTEKLQFDAGLLFNDHMEQYDTSDMLDALMNLVDLLSNYS